MVKKLLLGLAVVAVIAVGAVVWLASNLDSIVKAAIERLGPEITGVSVKVRGVKISPTDGRGTITGLVLGNPPGFKTPHALALDEITLALDPASLTQKVVVIREIAIRAPSINYEKSGSASNLDVIQRNVESYSAKHGGSKQAAQDETKLVINDLYVRDGRIGVSTGLMEGKAVTAALPPIHLKDIGRKSNGATASEVTRQVLGAVAAKTASAAGSALAEGAKAKAGEGFKGLFK